MHSFAHSGAHLGAHSGAQCDAQCDAHYSCSTAHAACSFGGMSYVRLDGETQGCLRSARGDCFSYPSPQSPTQMPQFRFEFSESETKSNDNLMNV